MMEINPWLDKWGKRVCNHPNFWMRLGRLENLMLSDRLAEVPINSPIFVAGMARSGSTMILEILNDHKDTKSFAYQDFPFVHIPWFWSQVLNFSQVQHTPTERAHKDRIMITPASPEAMEEMLWMHLIPNLHDENVSHLKSRDYECGTFASYYVATIKKLLLVGNCSRYLSKGNYNVTRIEYLLKLFPDARFVIPIRNPVSHIWSSMKQHKLFLEAQRQDRRVLDHLQRVGHFEFGNERKAINTGNPCDSANINSYFNQEKNLIAYAKQWNVIYDYVAKLMENSEVAPSVFVVKYEELCEYSQDVLINLFAHCRLKDTDWIIDKYIQKLSPPNYYTKDLSMQDIQQIKQITEKTAQKFGYSFDESYKVFPSVK